MRHRVGEFSTRLPLSFRSLFPFFKHTSTNDICWVYKSRTGEATYWPGKLKISPGSGKAKFSPDEGENPLNRVALALLQRGVLSTLETRCSLTFSLSLFEKHQEVHALLLLHVQVMFHLSSHFMKHNLLSY